MTALERLRLLAGAHASTGAALRSLVGVAGVAGALLVAYSGLPTGSAAQHLLSAGTVAQPVVTSITVSREPRVWVAVATKRVWLTDSPTRVWAVSKVPGDWVAIATPRGWDATAAPRLWTARLATTVWSAEGYAVPWTAMQTPGNWTT